jgi:hypothetical protein
MRKVRFAGVAALAIALELTTATAARAQNAGDQAAAEALFDQGKTLMTAGRYADACPKFLESNRLDQGIGTSLWLAQCYEKNGQSASAWAMFREAAALATKSGDPREKVARARAQALDHKLARLVLIVPGASRVPDLHVARDGTEVGIVLWNTAVPTDPGPHSIVVSAEGRRPQTLTINVLPGPGEQALTIPLLALMPVAPVVEGEAPSDSRAHTGNGGSTRRIAGIAVGVAGVVGVGVASYFGLHAKSELDDSNQLGVCGRENQPNSCTRAGVDDRDSATSAATVSTVLFVVSAAAIAAGVVLYVTAPAAKHATTALRATPWMASQAGGVVLEAEF